MARATGTRLLAAFFALTIVGLPISAVLWYHARQKEKERERELEALEKLAEEKTD